LPEKAVQTLEMIKTIFNVDSFAFVLALDDEVIERGIAHRYKDYALVDKKQQMPITGFEYLEKIVHLPFRLPQLTKTQAQNFIKFEEKRIVGDKQTWFTVQPLAKYDGSLKHDGSLTHSKNLDSQETQPMVASVLTGLFLASFEAYVPRKMVRVIELMHQIAHITSERGKPLAAPHSNIDEVAPEVAGGRDIRVVFTLLMLQLFQPELFRLLRRKEAAFPTLLAAFASDLGGLSGNEISEIDLWTWATFRKQGDVRNKVSNASEALAGIAIETQSIYNAQQIRLPVVIKLVEHLQIQRHVFNPLKLINALAKSLGESAKAVQISEYFSLLGEQVVAPISGHASMNLEPATMGVPTFDRLNDIQNLVDAVTESDTGGQANLASRLVLPALLEGTKLGRESCQKLREALKSWLTSDPIDGKAAHLLQGLSYISPWVDWHLGGKDLWALVSNEIETDTDQLGRLIKLAPALSRMKNAFWFNDSKTLDIVRAVLLKYLSSNGLKPEYRARTGDALGMIGDPRFEGKYALANRVNGDADEAPAGFVKIRAGKFVMGSKEDKDNPVKTLEHKLPYYVSRYPVTVAQYAAFIEADGYKDQALWESTQKQAWDWQTGDFDSSKVLEGEDSKAHREWLASRPEQLRHEPMNWAGQKANANRPVTGVTWFEATVYAAWLERQRQARTASKADLDQWGNLNNTDYRLRLPTEGEWERAARAGGTGKFPWGDDEAGIDQRANLNCKIGHATTVGSYPPNALGLYDMAGNVWQWQANLYTNPYENKFILPKTPLEIGKDYQTLDTPAQRGGSWIDSPDDVRCSCRNGDLPDIWDRLTGFRLVLSLADFES
jgi:formylglycine-generating enzyme required for sulfatase activity